MKMAVGCDLSYEIDDTTTFIFNVAVAQIEPHAQVDEKWIIEPQLQAETITTGLDNRYTRLVVRNGMLRLRYEASLDLQLVLEDPHAIDETPLEDLPLDMFPFLMPSRFCPSDKLADFAEREFAGLPGGHGRVTAICNWIYDNIAYRPGTSDPFTSAAETLQHRAGVCRDFAHLGISFCRALNIPARLVSSYAPWARAAGLSRNLRGVSSAGAGGCSIRRDRPSLMASYASEQGATRPRYRSRPFTGRRA